MSIGTIQDQALSLPPKERAQLIDVLWESLAAADMKSREAAWAQESERRIDAFEMGNLTARNASDVFFDLRKVTKSEPRRF